MIPGGKGLIGEAPIEFLLEMGQKQGFIKDIGQSFPSVGGPSNTMLTSSGVVGIGTTEPGFVTTRGGKRANRVLSHFNQPAATMGSAASTYGYQVPQREVRSMSADARSLFGGVKKGSPLVQVLDDPLGLTKFDSKEYKTARYYMNKAKGFIGRGARAVARTGRKINNSTALWGLLGRGSLAGKLALPALMVGGFGLYGAFSNLIGERYSMHNENVSYLPSPRSMLSGPAYRPTMSFRRDMNATGDLALALHNQRKA